MTGQFGTSLNNPPKAFEIVNVMPDYSQRITRTTGESFTMPYDGYVFASSYQGGERYITIDGFKFAWTKDGGFAESLMSGLFPVKKGSVVIVEASNLIFTMPCFGDE